MSISTPYKMQPLFSKFILIGFIVSWFSIAQAELTIEITQGVETTMPVAVVPFGWTGNANQAPVNMADVISANLYRTGQFKTLSANNMLSLPQQLHEVRYKNWKVLGQEYIVIGRISQQNSTYQVEFSLIDIYMQHALLNYRLNVNKDKLRATAHHISDLVYEKLTGRPGVFNTHLAYVTTTGNLSDKKYQLIIADADGFNPITIASSKQPIMSPSWSSDGKQIAYVSFENKRSAIYIQTLATGQRRRVAAFSGINGAPAFSPDNKRLALTLSKDGSADIYILNLETNALFKLTKSFGIETEAAWSPDGNSIVYTSDRGGKPQLYQIPSRGGRSRRITFSGDYNARARFSADGKSLAMVHANRGDYRIAVMDLASKTINVLTAGKYDESPSFSPNGAMLLYTSKVKGSSILSAVSIDGRLQQNLSFNNGSVREPAWSP